MPAPHYSTFLQAGCPSCCPTDSVKALKAPKSKLKEISPSLIFHMPLVVNVHFISWYYYCFLCVPLIYISILCFMSRHSSMKSSTVLCYDINELTYWVTYIYAFSARLFLTTTCRTWHYLQETEAFNASQCCHVSTEPQPYRVSPKRRDHKLTVNWFWIFFSPEDSLVNWQ